MVEISYKKHIQLEDARELVVCYNLLSENNKYSVECFIENSDYDGRMDRCIVKDFTKDKETGRKFVEMLANGEVLPIHVQDILADNMEDILPTR